MLCSRSVSLLQREMVAVQNQTKKDHLNKRFGQGYSYAIKGNRTTLVQPVGDTLKVAVFGLTGKIQVDFNPFRWLTFRGLQQQQ